VVAVITLFLVVVISLLVVRVATVALTHTGLSREAAQFQARSAFTGVGFTTKESESVVNHPVRRRIVMWLMLLGNAGIVTTVSTLVLSFTGAGGGATLGRLGFLAAALIALWLAAESRWLDARLSRLIERLLKRFSHLEVGDYTSLLKVGKGWRVSELRVERDFWLAGKSLQELELRQEGLQILGITRVNGEYVGAPDGATVLYPGDSLILYGRQESFHVDWRCDPHASGRTACALRPDDAADD
jgi:hypothetical protein